MLWSVKKPITLGLSWPLLCTQSTIVQELALFVWLPISLPATTVWPGYSYLSCKHKKVSEVNNKLNYVCKYRIQFRIRKTMTFPEKAPQVNMLFVSSFCTKNFLGFTYSCNKLHPLGSSPSTYNKGQNTADSHMGIINTPLTLCWQTCFMVCIIKLGGGTIQTNSFSQLKHKALTPEVPVHQYLE